jgi:Kef-type K+ transport system membrane component KefB
VFDDLSILAILGLAVAFSLYAGRLARKVHLPSIIGYMLLGVVIGGSGWNLLSEESLGGLSFITEICLGFVAFSIGTELSISSLKRHGYGITSIILAESFGAFLVVWAAVYLVTKDMPLSLIFGAVAPASAPAGTVAVIQEYKSKGSLTKALYAVVGFDDALAILIFGFAYTVARNSLLHEAAGGTEDLLPTLWVPAKEILLSLLVGAVIGFVFCQIVRKLQNPGEILIIVFGAILFATGISLTWNLSLILTNMVLGFVLVNTRSSITVRRVMGPVMNIMPLLFVLFFCLAGAHLQLSALPQLGLIGLVYVIGRSAGLIGGSRVGAILGGVEEKVKKYIGLGILSQAGVAIGLALIAKQQLDQLGTKHALEVGSAVIATVTATSVIFEIVGPILTKVALRKTGEIPQEAASELR